MIRHHCRNSNRNENHKAISLNLFGSKRIWKRYSNKQFTT
uniref:Uncharacterized protein n=1 Tax=Rhizophora mucronata TaxID=61149 RepID=A0A2P2NB04_RHIMU